MNQPTALVAVVDDEASVRTMLRRALHLAGYEVLVFGSGEEFLASLATHRPACVVLDVHMPGLSGFDVASRLQADGSSLPVIFITASDGTTLQQQAHAANAACVLHKPFSTDVLLAALRRVIAQAGHGTT